MRIVWSWLAELVDVDRSPEALGALLAEKGAHPESLERPWDGLEGVLVARVIEVRDHPTSDKLCVARVHTGASETEVVVGVRNMGAGDLVPLAPPGARVPVLPEPLGMREIDGVASNGMLCSPRELGIADVHTGILILEEPDLEPGADLKAALGLDEVVLDLEIESNRPDLLSHLGIAREVAAATGGELRRPVSAPVESHEPAETVATVEVKDAAGCPRYLAKVIRGLGDGATPLHVQARLTAAGMRPISPSVDATNYALLELGQPLHAFDLGALAGPGIVVRRAEDREPLTTLDDVGRELTPEDLLICDLEQPVALAGIIGGASAEVGDATRDVLLESASFEPRGVLRTSRRLQLLTEASIRFSRGVDPEGVEVAAARAAELMVSWSGGGAVLRGSADVGQAPARRSVAMRASRATAVLGYDVTPEEAVAALAAIDVHARAGGDVVTAEIPGFRPDLEREVDLIEEVVRVQGYGRLPSSVPAVPGVGGEQASIRLRRRVRSALVRAGLREIASLSFATPEDLALLGGDADPVRVANPPSADQPFLRVSLIPALLDTAARNLERGVGAVALFEVGHVFRLSSGQTTPVDERERIAAVLAGGERALDARGRVFDVLDAAGTLESMFESLGIEEWELGEPLGPPFHPGRSAEVRLAGREAGSLGELLPSAASSAGIEERVAVWELDASALAAAAGAAPTYREMSKFPPVRRDLAFVLPAEVRAADVGAALVDSGGGLVDRCELFDVFEGHPLPSGRKSLAFAVDLRAPDRTLQGEEADAVVAAMVERVASAFGGTLRTG